MTQWHWNPETYLQNMLEEVPSYPELQEQTARAAADIPAEAILELGIGTGETARRILAEEDLPGVCCSLQACGEIRGSADDRNISIGHGSRDHGGPDGDADPDAEVEHCGLTGEGERCLERMRRMVEAGPGRVEGRHHGVPGELVDEAVMARHLGCGPPM